VHAVERGDDLLACLGSAKACGAALIVAGSYATLCTKIQYNRASKSRRSLDIDIV